MITNKIRLVLMLSISIFTNMSFGYVWTTCDYGGLPDFFGGHVTFNLTNSLTEGQKAAIKRGISRVPQFSNTSITLVDNNDSDYGRSNGENEIFMHPAFTTAGCERTVDLSCDVRELDLIFGSSVDWATDEVTSFHMPFTPYDPEDPTGTRPMAGTAAHEGGHCLGLAHEGRHYNMMGRSFSHVTRYGTSAYYGPGEDASNGLIMLYGKKTLDNSKRDVGATIMRWDYARELVDGNYYSEHKFGVLRDTTGSELPLAGRYLGQYNYRVQAGDTINMELTLENNGEQDVEYPELGFYVSINEIISASDTLIGTASPDLGRNVPYETSYSVTIPSTLMEGYYFLGTYVDYDQQIDEVTSLNNTAWYPIDLVGIPDLVVLSPTVDKATLLTGESFSISVDVKNQGTGTSSETTVHYYASLNDAISMYDDEIGTEQLVSTASPGATVSSLATTATAPSLFGTYWVGACVVPVDGEVLRDNNCSVGVPIGVNSGPDLNVSTPLVNDPNALLYPGQAFTIGTSVRNEGAGSSESTILHYYVSLDDSISMFDTETGTADPIPNISTGGLVRAQTTATAPVREGTFWIGACVESVIGDVNATNDCSDGVEIKVTKEETSCSDNTIDPVIGGDVEYRGEANCIASVSITTEPTVVLKPGSVVYYEAPIINLHGGFSAELGSIFRASRP